MEDCEQVSRQLEEVLDSQSLPLVKGSYLLEVQSPGINRELKSEKEFQIFAGQMVEVKSRESIAELGCCFQGRLLGTSQHCLIIDNPQPISQGQHCGQLQSKTKVVQQDTIIQVEVELSKIISVCLYPCM